MLANCARGVLPDWLVSRVRRYLKGHDSWLNPDFAGQYAVSTSYEKRFPTALENHLAAYLQTHSLPALLHHEDRNSMAFSVEARLPFLDVRLVDFLFRLPARLKLRNGRGKFILRQAMEGILPEMVRARTDKMGFVTPQDRWLRETLRPDVEQLFNDPAFAQRAYWDAGRLRKAYRAYCAGRLPIGDSIWRWICLELWQRRFFG